jgi:hypothetical protein
MILAHEMARAIAAVARMPEDTRRVPSPAWMALFVEGRWTSSVGVAMAMVAVWMEGSLVREVVLRKLGSRVGRRCAA